jgi:hypothetical protein
MQVPFIEVSGGTAAIVAIGMLFFLAIFPQYRLAWLPVFILHSVVQISLLVVYLIQDGWSGHGAYLWMLLAPTGAQIFAWMCVSTSKDWHKHSFDEDEVENRWSLEDGGGDGIAQLP